MSDINASKIIYSSLFIQFIQCLLSFSDLYSTCALYILPSGSVIFNLHEKNTKFSSRKSIVYYVHFYGSWLCGFRRLALMAIARDSLRMLWWNQSNFPVFLYEIRLRDLYNLRTLTRTLSYHLLKQKQRNEPTPTMRWEITSVYPRGFDGWFTW